MPLVSVSIFKEKPTTAVEAAPVAGVAVFSKAIGNSNTSAFAAKTTRAPAAAPTPLNFGASAANAEAATTIW